MAEDTITVKSGLKDDRVALWEKDDLHPGTASGGGQATPGEAFVAGDLEVEVGQTPLVMQKLRDGSLVQVGGKKLKLEEPEAAGAAKK